MPPDWQGESPDFHAALAHRALIRLQSRISTGILMQEFFHFRDDPAIQGRSIFLTVCANQLTYDPPLGILQRPFPFTLGMPLYPKREAIPVVNTGAGELFPLMVQHSAVFAEAGLAVRIERELKDLVQVFKLEDGRDLVPEGLPESLMQTFKLLNARRQILPIGDHRLINLTRQVDCIDFARSDIGCPTCDPTSAGPIFQLVIAETKVASGDLIFRLAQRPSLVIATELGRQKLMNAGVPASFFGREIFEGEEVEAL